MKKPDWTQLSGYLGIADPGRTYLPVLTLIGVAVLALSVVFNECGTIHWEWWGYIPFHLGPGSIWAKIFDSRTLDQDVYAGRELSYLIDHVDMLLVAKSVKWGCPLFVSFVHLVLSVFIGVWIAWFAARDLKLGSLVGLLLALLFWTTPYVYLYFLMRTAKGLTAAGLVVLVIEIHRACAAESGGPDAPLSRRRAALVALAAGVMSFSDRQGFYFLLCALGWMALEWLRGRRRVARDLLLMLGAVLAVELVYFFWIAPALTEALWNYPPNFSFNQLPWSDLGARPAYFGWQAGELLVDTIGLMVAQPPHWVVLLLLAATCAAALAGDLRHRSWRTHLPLAGGMVAMFAALWVMYLLMILRHPPLLWIDVRRIYYWIPTGALVLLGIAGGAHDWTFGKPGRKIILAGLLLALVVGNIVALPGHRRVLANGHLHDSMTLSREMRVGLMHRGDPHYITDSELEQNTAYRTLLAFAPERTYPDQYGDGEFYRRTRDSGAPGRFVADFGGNVDARFLSTTGRFFTEEPGRAFIGTTASHGELRIMTPTNRMRGELVLRRAGAPVGVSLSADFSIYAHPNPPGALRFERWHGRIELAAGQNEATARYEIDGSGLPTLFTAEVPPEYAGRVIAGWRNPQITDVGRDYATPAWFSRSTNPVVALDEAALVRLLPEGWRPEAAFMRGGRLGESGIELSAGGEIWLRMRGLVTRFAGVATVPPDGDALFVRGMWYKSGRLEFYSGMRVRPNDHAADFHATSAEPGGWLVIAVDPAKSETWATVRVQQVEHHDFP